MNSSKWINSAFFWGFHLACLVLLFLHPGLNDFIWILGLYFFRMFFITAGYHRYFSHRAYSTSRTFQFLLAFFAMTSSQKGVLWWASNHRHHHRNSDQEQDLHSPKDGFFWSHCGWFLSERFEETDLEEIRDFAKYPELVWLDRYWQVPMAAFSFVLYLIGGWRLFYLGVFPSTVLLWHGTFTINSLSHVWGTRRFETTDTSRNNGILAAITLGEGWHNNHHRHPSSTRNGLRWWEWDATYYTLRALKTFGIVWGFRRARL